MSYLPIRGGISNTLSGGNYYVFIEEKSCKDKDIVSLVLGRIVKPRSPTGGSWCQHVYIFNEENQTPRAGLTREWTPEQRRHYCGRYNYNINPKFPQANFEFFSFIEMQDPHQTPPIYEETSVKVSPQEYIPGWTLQRPPTPKEPERPPVFDIPSLLKLKTSPAVSKAFGGPPTCFFKPSKVQQDMGITEGSAEFHMIWKEGKWELTRSNKGSNAFLMIGYELKRGKIKEWFLGMNAKTKEELLQAGGLSRTGPGYTLRFVKALKPPPNYTGVEIRPWK